MAASRTGKLDAVELLLEADSDPNAADTYQTGNGADVGR